MGDNKLASLISVSPKPTFDPSEPSPLPSIDNKNITATVSSPSLGACTASISYVLNSDQIGVVISAADTLPATDCASFTDNIAKEGFKATLANVPYPNSSTTVTVTIDLSP